MTYLYEVVKTGKTIEVQQRITEPAHTVLEIDGELVTVKRLISGAPGFNLIPGPSGGWASDGYSEPENIRKASAKLGHKVRRQL